MMSQSGPRIIKHSDAEVVSVFQRNVYFYAYGPFYKKMEGEANSEAEANQKFSKSVTKEAWDYFVDQARRDSVLKNTILRGIQIDEEKEVIKGYYMGKLGEVLNQARHVYDGANIREMLKSRFDVIMINHGCLFLLQMLVFLGLGVNKLRELSKLHDYQLDTLFGTHDEDIEGRKIGFTKSAVFPGNQIPLLVLNKLIDTSSFLKKVVLEENLEKPSSSSSPDLVLKSILYDLILGPVRRSTQEATVDILHALHSRLVGTTTARGDIIRFQYGNVDPEALPLIDSRRNNNLDPQSDNNQRIQDGNVDSEAPRIDSRRNNLNPQREKMSKAIEMHDKGLDFEGVSGMAITEIKIKGSAFTKKVLHLPVFTFNEMTKDLYRYLKEYENHQCLREKVVNDYLRFLNDIVQCDLCVLLLQQKGVIEVDSDNVEIYKLVVEYLEKVACDAPPTCTTHHLRTLRLAITHHHLNPWYYKCLTCALVSIIIAIISLAFTILQHFNRSRS
nr:uncharacterized protein LOC109175282 [Ipomoea batatas]GMD03370.1 uncharacterized protein LOC109175282 [Ipomoea batatas]GMD64895.1 uncharacterized protein LOC109175282 [Ipomoea batatas]